jgi:hypothetical protein
MVNTQYRWGASHFLNTGRGRPKNSQPGTAALRNAGVPACELRHRLGALLKNELINTGQGADLRLRKNRTQGTMTYP